MAFLKTFEANIPFYFTELYTVLDWIFSYCPEREGGFTYPEFITTLYGDMKKGKFDRAESLTTYCCYLLTVITDYDGVEKNSREYLNEVYVGFEPGLSEEDYKEAMASVEAMSVEDRVDWVHNIAELIKNGELDD